jgi:hypothetical protein
MTIINNFNDRDAQVISAKTYIIGRYELLSPLPRYLSIVLKEFFQICLFQKGPQDLPASGGLFWPTMFLYAIMSAMLSYPTQTLLTSLLSGVIESSILLSITYLFLYLRSVPNRWMQAATALAGTGIVFSLLVLPLYYLRVFLQAGPEIQDIIMTVIIFLWFWNIAVMSYILKNAFSSSYLLAALGALAYVAIIMLSLQQIFPVPPPA